MVFTDSFIQLPIQVYDRKQKDLIGTAESENSYMKIRPFEIASYRPTWDTDDPNGNEITAMTTKVGDTTLIYLKVAEFEELINKFVGV